ncbi:polyketide synthase [Colletotrichum incanum]|uniref:Polyketide synthase n=1 Tax=Colletotrichum incanum TaxID=1573173 RepID=A0A166LB10_COLIC|nr:polyketide synthase [Colletotrichum incanum]
MSVNSQTAPDSAPIAICGMGLRLPGDLHTTEDLYSFLLSGLDARSLPDEARYNAQAFPYQPAGGKGTSSSTKLPSEGYWLKWAEISNFDPSLFHMARKEVEKLDPQQRILLRVAWEALESAAEADWRGKKIGCYVGSFGDDWRELHARDTLDPVGYRLSGYMDFALSNHISSVFDLRGPSMTMRVACSASGLALHLVCQAIRVGEYDAAIVAGSNIILSPDFGLFMAEHGIISPDASCRAFEAQANGYARAEAVNCVFIKRYDLALRDGNPVRAIIRGSATNADGKTVGVSTPSPEAHEALIRSAYRMAGIQDLCGTAMVECHGTGTTVGDAVETCAIARVFGENGVIIGSTKPALGHSEGASALTSIIKAVLSLEHRTIIPNIKFHSPSLRLPLKSGHLSVPTTPQSWPPGRLERISINSFGIGGTNVHLQIILDAASSAHLPGSHASSRPRDPLTPPLSPALSRNRSMSPATLLLFSAGHEESLRRHSEQHLSYYKLHPDRLTDLSYTLARRRLHQPLRSYRVIDKHGKPHPTTPTHCIRSSPQKGTAGVVFVFAGQGSSWARMGVDLLKSDPTFLQDIRAMDAILKALPLGRHPAWTIQGELIRPETSSRLGQAEFSQPVCAALQIALVRRLERHDVAPGAVVGHSSGVIAAAYAAGALSLEDAVTAAYYRGLVCRKSGGGSMLSVGMSRVEVSQFLVSEVTVACENSNASVTLSGPVEALQQVTEAIRTLNPDAFIRQLRVNNAYHSSLMARTAEEYQSLLQTTLHPKTPVKRFYSSVAGRFLRNASDLGTNYWHDNMLKPVLFRQAVKALLADRSVSVHIEIGPHPALSAPLKQIGTESGMKVASVPVMSRGTSAVVTFLATLGELHCRGIPVDLPIPQDAKALGDLPPYPWNLSKTYWSESRVMRAWRFRRFPPHELLGIRNADDSDISPTWRCTLSVDNVPWIKDHCVGSNIVFPAAAYVAMAGEIFFQLTVQLSSPLRPSPKDFRQDLQSSQCRFPLRPPRLVKRLSMPTYAEEIFVDGEISAKSLHGNATATTACTTGPEDPVFYAKGFCFSPGAQEPLDAEPHGAIQMVWKPSPDLLDPSPLLCTTTDTQHAFTQQLLESFSVICAITIRDAAALLPESSRAAWPSHFTKLHAWLDGYIARNGCLADAALTSVITRDTELVTTYEAIKHTSAADAATLMLRCATHAEYILDGVSSALDLFLQGGTLHRLYDWMNSLWSYEGYLELVSHQRGNHLRVFEIGAGTGGLTARVLEELRVTAEDGEMHGTCVFTDISAGFFAAAKERFKNWAGVEYRILDITRTRWFRGLKERGTILLLRVLHVTDDVTQTLRHVRSLLEPEGRLLMQELACEIKWINLIMGFLPGWWLGERDTRGEEPYMSPDQWNEHLLQAGFSSPDCVVLDAEPPYHLNATIIARPASLISRTTPSHAVPAAPGPQVTLLHDEESLSTETSHLDDLLLQHGYKPTPIRLGDPILQGPVISLLDLSSSAGFFTAMTQEKLDALNGLLEMLKKTDNPLLWLTKPCQVCPTDPSYAPVLGVARTSRQELGVRFAVLELDSCDFRAMTAVWQVMSRKLKLSYPHPALLRTDDLLDDDMEFVYRSETDCVLIPRSTWISVPEALIDSQPKYLDTQTSTALQISRPGHLHTLSYAIRNHPPALSSTTVKIRIHAAGLNFKDVLTALNISSVLASSGPASLGCEAAGIVTAVGASVSRVCVGDRVMLFAPQAGCFSTSFRIPEAFCTRIPDEISFEDAAGMPCVFATMLRALVDKARLGPGRTVLVHSAAGGCLAKGTHIGKIVIDFVDEHIDHGSLPLSLCQPEPIFCSDPVYIIAGGIGGLGASIIRWLAHHGARNFAILSRSAGSSGHDASVIAELRGMGCKVCACICDVADEDAVRAVMSGISRSSRIGGVIHLAMVLADVELSRMTMDEWQAAVAPKVAGTWNLHHALGDSGGEDFFVLIGSMFGVTGRVGQANYAAAANTFLDSFVQFRRGLGMPCSVLDVGPVEDVGTLTRKRELREAMGSAGAGFLTDQDVLDGLHLAIIKSREGLGRNSGP